MNIFVTYWSIIGINFNILYEIKLVFNLINYYTYQIDLNLSIFIPVLNLILDTPEQICILRWPINIYVNMYKGFVCLPIDYIIK